MTLAEQKMQNGGFTYMFLV